MSNVKKSSEMPVPQTLDYWVYYRVKPAFVKDLNEVLGNVAYADAKPFFDALEERDNDLSAAQINEFVRRLARLPYKYVKDMMDLINNTETFGLYFEAHKESPKNNFGGNK